MSIEACLDELVKSGIDDWVPDADVAWIAKSVAGARSPSEIHSTVLTLVAEALRRGLMEIGEIFPPERGFRSWGLPVDAAVAKLESEWRSKAGRPLGGEIFWLRNTDTGRRRAKRLLPDAG